MIVYFAAALFLAGLIVSFAALYTFERQVREIRKLERPLVRVALRRLLAGGIVSGVGMGLMGLAAIFGGRSSAPGWPAYALAAFFFLAAAIGWPGIFTAAFMARVNALSRLFEEKKD